MPDIDIMVARIRRYIAYAKKNRRYSGANNLKEILEFVEEQEKRITYAEALRDSAIEDVEIWRKKCVALEAKETNLDKLVKKMDKLLEEIKKPKIEPMPMPSPYQPLPKIEPPDRMPWKTDWEKYKRLPGNAWPQHEPLTNGDTFTYTTKVTVGDEGKVIPIGTKAKKTTARRKTASKKSS